MLPLSVRYRSIEMPAVVILYNVNYHVEFVSWRGPRLSVDHSTGPQGRALSLPPDRKQVVSETKEQSSLMIILIMKFIIYTWHVHCYKLFKSGMYTVTSFSNLIRTLEAFKPAIYRLTALK